MVSDSGPPHGPAVPAGGAPGTDEGATRWFGAPSTSPDTPAPVPPRLAPSPGVVRRRPSTTAPAATGELPYTASGPGGPPWTGAQPPPRGGGPVRAAGQRPGGAPPRRSTLFVRRVDPWSVLKFTFVWSLCLLVVLVVAIALLYGALASMGVFSAVNRTLAALTATPNGGSGFSLKITPLVVIGGAAAFGAVATIFFTALAAVGAFLYNVVASLAGGVEVTFSDRA